LLGLSVSVMVPNSLGPAELLLHYGTEAQKNHYLPRLAKGSRFPAFALTSPWAGSDAGSIPDVGIVCKGIWQGKEVLGMRVTWDKRYITLGPVCTILGLAFHLYDPDGLLGDKKHVGITCALVPRDTPGAEIGRRHFPLNAMFMNGPTRGKDVFMPLDYVIGGPAMVGPGLADADGVSGRGPLDLAAVVEYRHGAADGAQRRCLRARSQPVQDGDRAFRGRRRAADPHRRLHLHDGRRAQDDGRRHRSRREAVGGLGDRQIPCHRACPPGGQ
jgi:alkylation response protein AidB-like acyl-CoA dehydrogenase